MALSVECPAEWDLAFLGADRLDVPRRRAKVMAVGALAKAPPSLAAPSPARRRGANRYRPASRSAVFRPLVVDSGERERVGETVSSADAFLGTRQNARAC